MVKAWTLTPLPRPEHPNPYTTTDRRPVYDSPWIRVREDRFRHRRGAEGRYAVCGFHRTACGVLALDEADRVVLVGQWRYPLELYSWEIPEGGGEPAESPFEAVRRELAEEAGLAGPGLGAPVLLPPQQFVHGGGILPLPRHGPFAYRGAPPGGRRGTPAASRALRPVPLGGCSPARSRDSLTAMALLALQARRSGVAAALDPALAERFFQRPDEHPSAGRSRWQNLGAP